MYIDLKDECSRYDKMYEWFKLSSWIGIVWWGCFVVVKKV